MKHTVEYGDIEVAMSNKKFAAWIIIIVAVILYAIFFTL